MSGQRGARLQSRHVSGQPAAVPILYGRFVRERQRDRQFGGGAANVPGHCRPVCVDQSQRRLQAVVRRRGGRHSAGALHEASEQLCVLFVQRLQCGDGAERSGQCQCDECAHIGVGGGGGHGLVVDVVVVVVDVELCGVMCDWRKCGIGGDMRVKLILPDGRMPNAK